MTQELLNAPAKKIDKKTTDGPYKDVLAFQKTGEVLLFNYNNYQVSVYIEISSLQIRSTVSVFETGAGPSVIRADGLDPVD